MLNDITNNFQNLNCNLTQESVNEIGSMISQFKGFNNEKTTQSRFEGYLDVDLDIAERIDVWHYF